ncbi:hypothetical protein B0T25DRAFT_597999 [Lasiosphaeria hispida]|uniref:Uncharacterized protein n=1 Tax=Lasiosphaeria hispida TaxID=260671 RepID=A0AAJ0ML14_9PEZI|nr:hypothetical protein B0T25DRAFT_597999 [Lasiosphaeria hispida]
MWRDIPGDIRCNGGASVIYAPVAYTDTGMAFQDVIEAFQDTFNTKIVAVLKRDSELLTHIQDSFHTMIMARGGGASKRIHITCFFEELRLPGVGQVEPQDSAILPGYMPIGIHSNHMDMTKFISADDPGFIAVCGKLRRWVKRLSILFQM